MALVVIAVVWGRSLLADGRDLAVRAAPLYGRWRLVTGWHTAPAIALGAAIVLAGPTAAWRLRWSALLAASAVTAMGWAVALALVDGAGALTAPLESRHELLPFARGVDDIGELVRSFTERLDGRPIHVQGHPPGMPVLLALLDRVGLGGTGWVAALVIAGGAAGVVSVLVLARELVGEATARAAAPFVAALPAAVWIASTADAVYAGVGLAGLALVAVATGRPGRAGDRLAVGGGVVLGLGVHLSYGLALLAPLVLALAWHRRRLRTLVLVGGGALAVTGAWLLAGFAWWDGLAATHAAYGRGVASTRPYGYFVVANLAALAIAVGPAVAAGVASTRGRRWLLVAPVLAVVLAADLSGLSKGEVERIWLFLAIPLGFAAVSVARRRAWLAVHVASGLALASILRSPW